VNPADAISLTKSLLRFDTVNPPGRERDCARFAGALLEEWGYSVEYFEHQVAWMKSWIKHRIEWLDKNLPGTCRM